MENMLVKIQQKRQLIIDDIFTLLIASALSSPVNVDISPEKVLTATFFVNIYWMTT